MHLEKFNQLEAHEAQHILKTCVSIPHWIADLTAQRPYASLEQLYQTAEQYTSIWQWADIAAALALHPRIGEQKAATHLSKKEQQFSQHEQAQISTDEELQHALYQGNLTYECKFGHIFLIRAAGRTGQEILSTLRHRLENTIEKERLEVKQQLTEIAMLRLKQEIQ